MLKYVIYFLSLFIFFAEVHGETTFFKRSKIVKNGNITTCCDDGHYMTFANNRLYDSDKDGFQTNGSNMKYIKTENNIKVYYGNCYYGTCYCYVSTDNDRLNLKINDNLIYVYERCSASNNVKRRESAGGTTAGQTYTVPAQPRSTSYPNKNTTPKSTRRVCPGCNGTGIAYDKITYQHEYNGPSEKVYCEKCGAWKFKHYHQNVMCRVCYGKGYVEN